MPWKPVPVEPEELRQVESLARRGRRVRVLVDEGVPQDLRGMMRRLGWQVVEPESAGLVGHEDRDYVAYALRDGLLLVSFDEGFADERRYPVHQCPGMIIFRGHPRVTREVVQALVVIADTVKPVDLFAKATKLIVTPSMGETFIEVRFRNEKGRNEQQKFRVTGRGVVEEWSD